MFDKMKHTLNKPSKKKPSFATIVTAAAFISPVGAGSMLLANEIQKNPQGTKNTLSVFGDEIKKNAPIIGNAIGSGLKKGSALVGNTYNKMMLPLICVGVIVVLILVKK